MNLAEPNIFEGIDKIIGGAPLKEANVSEGLVSLEKAANQIEFIESEEFLAGPSPLWPEQCIVIRDFFELLCPLCNDIPRIREKRDVPRDKQILFRYDVCPKCGTKKLDVFDSLSQYNELIGVVGMRGGKSVTIAAAAAAHLHTVLCIEGLAKKLNLIKSQTLDGSFAAAASEQATETVYANFRGLYDESPWFQNYKKALMDLELENPNYRRGDLYRETDTSIHWRDKRIRIQSISTNSAAQAGKTRFMAISDELARLDAGDSKRSATEVYRVLNNSLLTVRTARRRAIEGGNYSLPDGLMMSISSPIYTEDKSMRLLKDAERIGRMFAFHKTTWEYNPNITKEDLADEFERDPIGAERDFGANPPGAESPFIQDTTLVDLCVDNNKKSVFEFKEDYFDQVVTKDGSRYVYRYIRLLMLNFHFNNLIEYAIHADPGERGDSFCFAMGHREGDKCIIDGAAEIRPIPKNNRQKLPPRDVHFPSVTILMLDIKKKVSIVCVTYDRWNSTDQIQRLVEANMVSVGKNLTREDHINFYGSMRNNNMVFPALERPNCDPKTERNVPCAKAIYELKRLNDDGKKVDHPPNGSNDIIQCYVGVHRILMTPASVLPKKYLGQNKGNKPASGKIVRLRR